MHLAVANLTGAIRLLIGLGWPMIYFVAAFFGRKTRGRLPTIALEREHAIEVMGLVPPARLRLRRSGSRARSASGTRPS